MDKHTKPFAKVRSSAIDGRVKNPIYKKDQLKQLHRILAANASEIQNAMRDDTANRTAVDVKIEYWLALQCVAGFHSSIDPEAALKEEYLISKGIDAPKAREAVGIVVIEPASHGFLYSLIAALAPAIAGGNCVIVQLDQSLLNTPRLVLGLISQALDADIFEVTPKPASDADIGHPHVRVLQKGSSTPVLTHHIVSNPDAPVVAFVERDADIEAAARAVVTARFAQGGKSPYAPDLVMVNEWVKKDFLSAVVQQQIASTTNGDASPKPKKTADFKLLTEAEKEGLSHVVSSAPGGTILDVRDRNSFLLQRKITQPCLIVHAVKSMDDAIDLSQRNSQLAAAFVFTTPAMAKYFCQFINSALTFVNQIPIKLLYGPIAPDGNPPNPATYGLYDTELFTVPRPKYVTGSKTSERLGALLGNPSPQHIEALVAEAAGELSDTKRPKRLVKLGFFEQGIVTGLALVLTTALGCTGVAGYYLASYLRGRQS